MQTRPDHSTLLEALASFLMADVAPKLEADKALQFRVLIAANLASVVAGEARTQDARLGAELGRLRAILGDQGAGHDVEALEGLHGELARRLRAGAIEETKLGVVLEHLLATAKETLAVSNPRFELGDEPAE